MQLTFSKSKCSNWRCPLGSECAKGVITKKVFGVLVHGSGTHREIQEKFILGVHFLEENS